MLTPQYIHLEPTSSPQNLEVKSPFAAVVVIDTKVRPEWRHMVSEWLVEKGCLYMLAHGNDCSLWDDSVDWVLLEAWDFKDIPEDKFIMTTWHEDDSLEEVFSFARNTLHFYPLIKNIIILDIADNPREQKMLTKYKMFHEDNDEKFVASSYAEKFSEAAGGTIIQRLNLMMPIFFLGILCLALWALIEALWPRLAHFLS